MSLTSIELDLVKVFAIRIVQVHSTRDARIEGVNRPQNFERLFRVCQLGANQRFLVGRALSFGIARRSIPSAGYYELVVFDFSILDPDPMRQGPARGLGQSHALRRRGPSGRFPAVAIEGGKLSGLYLRHQIVVETPVSYTHLTLPTKRIV